MFCRYLSEVPARHEPKPPNEIPRSLRAAANVVGARVLALVLALALALVASGCGGASSSRFVREAVGGVFDASGWNPARDGALPLRGEWYAAWGVQPNARGELDPAAPRSPFRMPERVEPQAPPGTWRRGQGMVSFVLELRGLPRDQDLAIHVPNLWSSALRCRSAEGAETATSASPGGDVRVVSSLAPYALVLPRAEHLTCVLAYAVPPPIEDWRSYISEAPSLDVATSAVARVSNHRAFYVALCVFMVTLASYLFVQWQARRRDRAPLFVALLFVSLAFWLAGYGAIAEGLSFPGFLLRRRIEYAAVSLSAAASLWACGHLLGYPPRTRDRVVAGASFAAGVVTLLVPTRLVAWALFTLVQPASAPCFALIVYESSRVLLARRSSTEHRILAASMVVPAVFGVLDLALARVADIRLGLVSYGLVLLGFSMALTLARLNASAHEAAEVFADRSSRFVPREFLHTLGHADLTTVQLGDARERPMTVLFADLRRFTALSEHLTPAETFAFLNDCFARLGPPIREHGGFVDKYIGDAIMALFPEDPAQAVRAALAMQKAIAEVPAPRSGGEAVGLGIGIHVGSVMMGTIGEERRFEATVISDAVNLAARLESLTKQMGCSLLVSGAIAHELPDDLVPHIRELGRFAVKGKSEPVTVVEVFALDPIDLRRGKFDSKVRFKRGIDAFLAGDFESGAEIFGRMVDDCPEDGPAHWWFVRAMREISAEAPRSTRRFVQMDEK
jgi:class 3 adenylate cyclase